MSYKTPLVCKDVFLPITYGDALTIAQYKEKYGIDLSKYITMEGGLINFRFPSNEKVYFVNLDNYLGLPSVSELQWDDGSSSTWGEGESDGFQKFLCFSVTKGEFWGISIEVNKNDPFDLDHVVIHYEIA